MEVEYQIRFFYLLVKNRKQYIPRFKLLDTTTLTILYLRRFKVRVRLGDRKNSQKMFLMSPRHTQEKESRPVPTGE